ncbi:hypothetical protein BH23GEM8_BH23GEM8_16190 [soil metagenome]
MGEVRCVKKTVRMLVTIRLQLNDAGCGRQRTTDNGQRTTDNQFFQPRTTDHQFRAACRRGFGFPSSAHRTMREVDNEKSPATQMRYGALLSEAVVSR